MLAKKINVGRGGLKSSSYIYPVRKKTNNMFQFKRERFVIKGENTLNGEEGNFLLILPSLNIWWGNGSLCIGFGWLNISIECWFGNVSEI